MCSAYLSGAWLPGTSQARPIRKPIMPIVDPLASHDGVANRDQIATLNKILLDELERTLTRLAHLLNTNLSQHAQL
jgi:hypothetical protein